MFMHRHPVTRPLHGLALAAAIWIAAAPLMRAAAQDATAYELTVVDSRGKKEVLGKVPASAIAPRVSPDGDKFAIALAEAGAPARVWVGDLEAPDKRKVLPAAGSGANVPGVWSADGTQIFLSGAGNG